MSDELFKELRNLDESLNAVKKNYEPVWQDTSKYFLPTKTDVNTKKTDGDFKDVFELYDSITVVSLDNFANILNGTLTNKSTPWFKVNVQNKELQDDDKVKEWLEDTTKKMWNEIYNPASNFEVSHYENLQAFGCFGNIAMKIEKGKESLYNFKGLHIKSYAFAENEEGKIDTCILTMSMQARQIVSKFEPKQDQADQTGEKLGKISDDIKKASEEAPYQAFEVKFFIMPRKDRDPSKIDTANKPYVGYWVMLEKKTLLLETGFDTFPIAFGRGSKGAGETYAVGRAVLALADARTLNRMTSDYLEAGEKSLKPPLVVNAEFERTISLRPLAINRTKGPVGMGRAIEPLIDTKGFQPTIELMLNKQEAIRKVFFLDKLVVLDDPRATATQILELRAESYRIMGSIATSIAEYLENILDRCFNIIFRESYTNDEMYNLLPEAPLMELPEKLKGVKDEITGQTVLPKFHVEFINPITQSQRSNQNNSIDAFVNSVMNMAQVNPQVIDKINFDEIVEKKSQILQIDSQIIRPNAEVESLRSERQQQIDQQNQMMGANTEANTLKTMKQAGL
jgi:hypothetical protein